MLGCSRESDNNAKGTQSTGGFSRCGELPSCKTIPDKKKYTHDECIVRRTVYSRNRGLGEVKKLSVCMVLLSVEDATYTLLQPPRSCL